MFSSRSARARRFLWVRPFSRSRRFTHTSEVPYEHFSTEPDFSPHQTDTVPDTPGPTTARPVAPPSNDSAPDTTSTNETITLERFALPQINQYGTATCAFNAATGIREILYAMKTGEKVNFSEPQFLACAPGISDGQTDWFWRGVYEESPDDMLPESCMPTNNFYRPGWGFDTAETQARNTCNRIDRSRFIPLGFRLKAHKLFFKAEWRNGNIRNDGRATRAEYAQTVRWFVRNKKPVNIHHRINGYWHSVIMIGYRPEIRDRNDRVVQTEAVQIKDSLGGAGVGTWKSKEWFLGNVYGAIGVTYADDPTPAEPESTV